MAAIRKTAYGHNRELRALEPHYSRHMAEMTMEGLNSKSDIAAELAFRDMEIEKRDEALLSANALIGEAADEAKRLQDTITALENTLEYESQKPVSETIDGNVRGFAAFILHGDEKHRAWLLCERLPQILMKDDIKSALNFAVRLAIDQSVSLDDLYEMVRKTYEEARQPKKIKSVKRGSLVMYVDLKKGPLMSHVLEVKPDGRLKIRVHQIAQPDFNRDDVAHSTKLKKEHWSYRT